MFFKVTKPIRAFVHKTASDEDKVIDGLAMTPSQMMELAQRGISVSTQSLGAQFYDDSPASSFDVPTIYQRGVDMADAFETSLTTKEKIKKGVRKYLSDVKE